MGAYTEIDMLSDIIAGQEIQEWFDTRLSRINVAMGLYDTR